MCSRPEELMTLDTHVGVATQAQLPICGRCKVRPVQFRVQESFCAECFIFQVCLKFRVAIGSSRPFEGGTRGGRLPPRTAAPAHLRLPSLRRFAVAYSGGFGSTVLLDMLLDQSLVALRRRPTDSTGALATVSPDDCPIGLLGGDGGNDPRRAVRPPTRCLVLHIDEHASYLGTPAAAYGPFAVGLAEHVARFQSHAVFVCAPLELVLDRELPCEADLVAFSQAATLQQWYATSEDGAIPTHPASSRRSHQPRMSVRALEALAPALDGPRTGDGPSAVDASPGPLGRLGSLRAQLREAFAACGSVSARDDLREQLRWLLLRRLSRAFGCNLLFSGDTKTTLASKTLSLCALGRGFMLPVEAGADDWRETDFLVTRPLRDVSTKEACIYSQLRGIPSLPASLPLGMCPAPYIPGQGNSSLIGLSNAFIARLQQEFPSTVSTVTATALKVTTDAEHFDPAAGPMKPCLLCLAPVPEADIQPTVGTRSPIGALAEIATTERLCYGCRTLISECD
ncbi:hypothetical protein H696_01024 [Fonticula alba]|uniref:Cytoplasmic tRNA 2-thiolation protein 2 n=1 Tax=Fonticula alba TaxID=691883 RepID=A0A058ZCD6_FONAL|nr:hypothetical protein H696_01024 [Fonticula alba]KCV71606.1 hypothetical protein H696_01024 [Fonticula alba]|eukprot:XP_009493184.1 hypothetical protein H696_01024 [Fonticula alba]